VDQKKPAIDITAEAVHEYAIILQSTKCEQHFHSLVQNEFVRMKVNVSKAEYGLDVGVERFLA
jgi:hypothetical protein